MLDILEYMNEDGSITERLRWSAWDERHIPLYDMDQSLSIDRIKEILINSFTILPMHAPDNRTATQISQLIDQARNRLRDGTHSTWYVTQGL